MSESVELVESCMDEELTRVLDKLGELDPASKEYSAASENLMKLFKSKSDEAKMIIDYDIRYEELNLKKQEIELKEKEAKSKINLGLKVAAVAIPLVTFVVDLGFRNAKLNQTFEFEKEGSFRSRAGIKAFDQAFRAKK